MYNGKNNRFSSDLKKGPFYNTDDVYRAIEQADIVAYLVAHDEFKKTKEPKNTLVLDFCGIKNKTND